MGGDVGILVGGGVANCLKGHGRNSHVVLSRPTVEPSVHSFTSPRSAPGGHTGAPVGLAGLVGGELVGDEVSGHSGNSHVALSRTKVVPSGQILRSGGQ